MSTNISRYVQQVTLYISSFLWYVPLVDIAHGKCHGAPLSTTLYTDTELRWVFVDFRVGYLWIYMSNQSCREHPQHTGDGFKKIGSPRQLCTCQPRWHWQSHHQGNIRLRTFTSQKNDINFQQSIHRLRSFGTMRSCLINLRGCWNPYFFSSLVGK